MFDTVNLRCYSGDMGGVNFIDDISQYMTITSEHRFENGLWLSGSVGNLELSISERSLAIKRGSLCKWHLGDNWQTMNRTDTKLAIENLSDTLHLPIEKSRVTRIDFAHNLTVSHPPNIYYDHLGGYYPYNRLQQPDGLYYSGSKRQLLFYDKHKEQKQKRITIPVQYQGSNVLRYEQRYLGSPHKRLGVQPITGADLYDIKLYNQLLERWRAEYQAIKKINDITLNFNAMKSKREMYTMGVLALIEKAGGEVEFLNQISNAVKCGDLTKKQAFDLRQAAKQATALNANIVVANEAINELNKQIEQTVATQQM